MSGKHTPGPWKKGGANDSEKIFGENFHLASVHGTTRGRRCNPRHEESQANARLIAAAPEMLEALRTIRDTPRDLPQVIRDICDYEIKKAQGKL